MKYLLDANTCVEYLRRGSATPVAAKMNSTTPGDIVLCSVVEGELLFGALRSNDPNKVWGQVTAFTVRFAILSFDSDSAREYASIRNYLSRIGQMIGPNDLMIAATALANGLILVTHNTAEFSRVPRLQLEDWQIP